MKKVLKHIVVNVLILLFGLLIIFIALIFIPKDIKSRKAEIEESTPLAFSEMNVEREELLENFDEFILSTATQNSKNILQIVFNSGFKLNWLMQKDIYTEVEDYNDDSLKAWYVYNMGVITKTGDTTVCFDLATPIVSPSLLNLAETCDYLFISHGDGDHYKQSVVKRILENNGKVFIYDSTGIWEEMIKINVDEQFYNNLYSLENDTETQIDDLKIYTYRTSHRGEDKDNAWFFVNVNGYNILHTGDGKVDDYRDWEMFEDIDLLLANVIVLPIDLKDIDTRYVIPLHMHEIAHNREFLEEATFTYYMSLLEEYEDMIDSKVYLLFWGESIEVEREE